MGPDAPVMAEHWQLAADFGVRESEVPVRRFVGSRAQVLGCVMLVIVAVAGFWVVGRHHLLMRRDTTASYGLWVANIKDARNVSNGWIPNPFHYDGQGVTLRFHSKKRTHPDEWLTLHSRWNGSELLYQDPDEPRNWISAGTFVEGEFVVEKDSKRWFFIRIREVDLVEEVRRLYGEPDLAEQMRRYYQGKPFYRTNTDTFVDFPPGPVRLPLPKE